MMSFKAGRFSIRIERAHGSGHRQRMALPHTPAVRLTRHGAAGLGRRPDLPSQQRAPDPAERPGGEAVPQRVQRDLVLQLRSIESIEAQFVELDRQLATGCGAKAKATGVHKGRKPTAVAQAGKVRRMAAEGMPKVAIAKELGTSRGSVYRALAVKAT